MNTIEIALLVLATLGTLYYILSILALVRHFRGARPTLCPLRAPPTSSLLKPVSGVDADARDGFLSFLKQDYPDYEVLFGVLEPDDPATDVISDAIQGGGNATLHVGSGIQGANNKVRILHNLAGRAIGGILVVTDADTRVTPDFLTTITRPFEDPEVGAVTCLYRGTGARTAADALEGLHMTCVFAPGVAAAKALGGIDFGLGAAIAVRRSALDAIGGFEAIVDYLADDYQLCHRVAGAGYRVVLSDYVVDIMLSGEPLRAVLRRELRWSRTTRVSRPIGHFGLVVTFGFTYALGFLIASGLSAAGWYVLATVLAVRLVTAWVGARICLGDRESPRRLHLLPARDVLSFGIWTAGYFSNTVNWRGRKLRVLRDGRMIEKA